ncbi:hypothetical protein EL17_21525 [Anditalea andensis]|uniref:Tail specific protease domain-containing protein n=2 Tax=Anditalea andensis TaxID=1048983 RepID=A0A074KVX7_9BACT|nr:hypothetical protein EL17_21525 [Anditalea andensis]
MLSACENIFFESDYASSDPFVNFDYLWNEIDRKYSYFELKEVDWDEIRIRYRAQLSPDMTEEALFDVMAAMMNELRDDHSNLISPFNISRYNLPLKERKQFFSRTVEEFYIPNAHITGPFYHDFIAGGTVGYIRYSSFLNNLDPRSLDHVLTRYRDTQGLILDLRENGGGAISNIPIMLERFTFRRIHAASAITRNGPLRSDFGPPEPFFIGAHRGIQYFKPVMVLIDRGSYSATTFFALLTKYISTLTLVGDYTGGGGGLPNGGQLPNGWTYRFSVSQILDLGGNNYAEQGVPPDIFAEFDWSDLSKDEIIIRALEELGVL